MAQKNVNLEISFAMHKVKIWFAFYAWLKRRSRSGGRPETARSRSAARVRNPDRATPQGIQMPCTAAKSLLPSGGGRRPAPLQLVTKAFQKKSSRLCCDYD